METTTFLAAVLAFAALLAEPTAAAGFAPAPAPRPALAPRLAPAPALLARLATAPAPGPTACPADTVATLCAAQAAGKCTTLSHGGPYPLFCYTPGSKDVVCWDDENDTESVVFITLNSVPNVTFTADTEDDSLPSIYIDVPVPVKDPKTDGPLVPVLAICAAAIAPLDTTGGYDQCSEEAPSCCASTTASTCQGKSGGSHDYTYTKLATGAQGLSIFGYVQLSSLDVYGIGSTCYCQTTA